MHPRILEETKTMNHKQKAKQALEMEMHAKVKSASDCPTCNQQFLCPMQREAHLKLYPSLFNGKRSQADVQVSG